MKRTRLLRRTPLRAAAPLRHRKPRRRPPPDIPWEELRPSVMARDGWRCMAPVLDPDVAPGECAGRFNASAWDRSGTRYSVHALTLQHVWRTLAEQATGLKPPDRPENLITVCYAHHVDVRGGRQWATSKRGKELQREYLDRLYPKERTQ